MFQHMGKRLKIFGKKSRFDINVYKTTPILLPMSRNTVGGKTMPENYRSRSQCSVPFPLVD